MPHKEAQLKGVVSIYWDSAGSEDVEVSGAARNVFSILPFSLSIPLRHSSIHYCLKANTATSALNKTIVPLLINAFPNYSAVRTRVHCASPIELQYMLQDHGIRMRTYPMDSNGKLLLDQWKTVLFEHGMIGFYLESGVKSLIIQPTSNDVLLGRGRPIQEHPGVSTGIETVSSMSNGPSFSHASSHLRMLPFGRWWWRSTKPMKRLLDSQGGW